MNISEETIDSFLRGDLNGTELETFNKALRSDPKLQQEVSFQQDIVDSIKQYRHNQLKSRLNAIDVPAIATGSSVSIYLKLVASIGIVALLVGTVTVLTNNKEETTVTNSSDALPAEKTLVSANAKALTPPNNISTEQQTTTTDQKSIVQAAVPTKAKQTTEDNKSTKTASNSSTQTSTNNLPDNDEMKDDGMSFDSRSENFNVPSINNADHSTLSASVVKVNIVKEKNLAYRYFNNELYLHGNFSNSTYELFELNNKPSKQLFLYFENKYYELIQGKTKVTDLVPITDKATLLQLAQLREH